MEATAGSALRKAAALVHQFSEAQSPAVQSPAVLSPAAERLAVADARMQTWAEARWV